MRNSTELIWSNRRGASTATVIIFLPVVLMMAWFGVEIGLAVRSVTSAKFAADAVALAAAARYRDNGTDVRADAQAAAAGNRGPNGPIVVTIGNGPAGGGDVEFGQWDDELRVFTVDSDGGPAVRARVRFAPDHPNGSPGLVLGGFFGTSPMAFERVSIAVYNPPRNTTSLLLNAQTSSAIALDNAARLVSKGGVSVRSTNANACQILPNASMQLTVLRLPGTIDPQSKLAVDGVVEESEVIPADPMNAIDLPTFVVPIEELPEIDHDNIGVTHVAPGVHGFLQANGGTVILDPGLHQFVKGIFIRGSCNLQLDHATIQFANSAVLRVAQSSVMEGTPADGIGDWSGYWFIQRGATVPWVLTGSAIVTFESRCYAPDTALQMESNAQARLGTAILGSVEEHDSALLEFTDVIDELTTQAMPGRARLVR